MVLSYKEKGCPELKKFPKVAEHLVDSLNASCINLCLTQEARGKKKKMACDKIVHLNRPEEDNFKMVY